jgi:signal transduction histidine kinase
LREIDDLTKALLARDRILAVVAHDLRNPVAVAAASVDMMLKTIDEPKTRRHARRIADALSRAGSLIDDLLDVAAIEQGKLTVEKQWLSLPKVVLDVMRSQRALAARRSLIISTDLSPELPRLKADQRRIHEVLENLVGNAIKFTQPGGHIIAGAGVQGGEVVVWVKDTGSGIAEEELPHVFDPFWQERSDHRGNGLGLGICRAIVEAHGGRIWAESTVFQGTTICFTLPV